MGTANTLCPVLRSPEYEAAKKRKAAIDALKAATPDAAEPHEIGKTESQQPWLLPLSHPPNNTPMPYSDIVIDDLERAMREAEMSGASQLKMPGDPRYGER